MCFSHVFQLPTCINLGIRHWLQRDSLMLERCLIPGCLCQTLYSCRLGCSLRWVPVSSLASLSARCLTVLFFFFSFFPPWSSLVESKYRLVALPQRKQSWAAGMQLPARTAAAPPSDVTSLLPQKRPRKFSLRGGKKKEREKERKQKTASPPKILRAPRSSGMCGHWLRNTASRNVHPVVPLRRLRACRGDYLRNCSVGEKLRVCHWGGRWGPGEKAAHGVLQ